MSWIIMWMTLTFVNYAYQACTAKDYAKALDRSWFQGAALLGAYLTQPWEGL
jgi:hypothetical protein